MDCPDVLRQAYIHLLSLDGSKVVASRESCGELISKASNVEQCLRQVRSEGVQYTEEEEEAALKLLNFVAGYVAVLNELYVEGLFSVDD